MQSVCKIDMARTLNYDATLYYHEYKTNTSVWMSMWICVWMCVCECLQYEYKYRVLCQAPGRITWLFGWLAFSSIIHIVIFSPHTHTHTHTLSLAPPLCLCWFLFVCSACVCYECKQMQSDDNICCRLLSYFKTVTHTHAPTHTVTHPHMLYGPYVHPHACMPVCPGCLPAHTLWWGTPYSCSRSMRWRTKKKRSTLFGATFLTLH